MPMGLESVSDFPSFGGAGGRGFKSGDFSWLLVIRHRRQAPKKKKTYFSYTCLKIHRSC